MEWTNKNNTIITKIQHPNSVQIDALIFAKFSLSLAYQWCFFRLYILISFHFFSSVFGFFFSPLLLSFLYFWTSNSYHIFRITLFWSFLYRCYQTTVFLLIFFLWVWLFTSTFQWIMRFIRIVRELNCWSYWTFDCCTLKQRKTIDKKNYNK